MKSIDWTPGFSSRNLSFRDVARGAIPFNSDKVRLLKSVAETGYVPAKPDNEDQPTLAPQRRGRMLRKKRDL